MLSPLILAIVRRTLTSVIHNCQRYTHIFRRKKTFQHHHTQRSSLRCSPEERRRGFFQSQCDMTSMLQRWCIETFEPVSSKRTCQACRWSQGRTFETSGLAIFQTRNSPPGRGTWSTFLGSFQPHVQGDERDFVNSKI